MLIAEAFIQLVEESPTTPRLCRIALVTGDQLLATAVQERTQGTTNVRILPSLDELKGLINTLVSQVDEEFVTEIHNTAVKYFFEQGNDDTLFLREQVQQRIRQQFVTQLDTVPANSEGKELTAIRIGATRFSRKEVQRVFWITRVAYEYKTYRFQASTAASVGGVSLATQNALTGVQPWTQFGNISAGMPLSSYGLLSQPANFTIGTQPAGVFLTNVRGVTDPLGVLSAPREKVFVGTGKIVFDVTWSVTVTAQRHSFSRGRIEQIDHVETAWGGPQPNV